MTAVACFKIKTHPLVFADLLLSSSAKPWSMVPLPSVEVRYGPEPSDGPKELCQKIAILADNMIVGWAANRISDASDIINGLKMHCEHKGFNSGAVAEYLRSQRRSTWNEMELAGFIQNAEIEQLTTFRSVNCGTIASPAFGDVILLGTGREMLAKFFQREISSPSIDQDAENLAVQAARVGMSMIGNYLTYEQFSCETLDNYFGGEYEIATLDVDKFVKLSDVLYAFWRATLSPDKKSVSLKAFPFFLFRYEYYGDLLVLRSISIKEKDGRAEGKPQVFVIPPVYRTLTAQEKSDSPLPQFSARWICNYVQILTHPDKMDIMTLAAHGKSTQWLQLEEYQGQLTKLTVTKLLYQEILRGIENRYHSNVDADLENA